jgi:hypothetical protein
MIFLHRPIAAVLVGLTVLILLRPVIARAIGAGRPSAGGPPPPAEAVSRT